MSKARIFYHDIGDYLSPEEKLAIMKDFTAISGISKTGGWITLQPDQHHDWVNQRDEYLQWIVGIANAEGGLWVIGINDSGEISGIADGRRLLEEIPNKARDLLGIVVSVRLKKSGRKEFLEIKIDPQPYPVSYNGQYHICRGATKQELKGMALDRFLLGKTGDKPPVIGITFFLFCQANSMGDSVPHAEYPPNKLPPAILFSNLFRQYETDL